MKDIRIKEYTIKFLIEEGEFEFGFIGELEPEGIKKAKEMMEGIFEQPVKIISVSEDVED
jgi:hypothetical protein